MNYDDEIPGARNYSPAEHPEAIGKLDEADEAAAATAMLLLGVVAFLAVVRSKL